MPWTPKVGDPVWFISKFGDKVTGSFKGNDPDREGWVLVESRDALGAPMDPPIMCSLPRERVRRS